MRKLTSLPEGWVTLTSILQIAQKYVRQTGVQLSIVMDIALKESEAVSYEGEIYLNPKIVNSIGYKGLFQFDPRGVAWSQAARNTMGVSITRFDKAWFIPEEAVKAVMVYSRQNYDEFVRLTGYRGPMTSAIVYLTHNQGAGGAAAYVKGKLTLRGVQSLAAIADARVAKAEYERMVA